MATIFTKIIEGEIPCYKIAENDQFISFLDISPYQKGHALVVPKREEDYIFNIEDDELAQMTVFAKRVAKAVEKVVSCKRIGMMVIGLMVPHAHIHLIPLQQESDLFGQNRPEVSAEEMAELAEKIKAAYDEA